MGRAVVRITPKAFERVAFPDGTTLEALRHVFDEDVIELRISHNSLPDTPAGAALMRVKLYNCSDGRAWFE